MSRALLVQAVQGVVTGGVTAGGYHVSTLQLTLAAPINSHSYQPLNVIQMSQ